MTRPLSYSLLCLAALIGASCVAHRAAADDLFSSIPIDTVFNPPSASTTPTPARPDDKSERIQRVLNITQLTDILRDAGLEPEAEEASVLVKLQHARWTFTVVLGLDEQREQIVLIMRLADLTGKPALSSDRLLAMLSASRELRPAFFSYSDKNKRVELILGIANDAISPRLLRDQIRRLAQMAEGTAGLWEAQAANTNVAATSPTASAGAKNAAAPPAGAATAAAPSTGNGLLGKWSAARSDKEAFAIQLNADNTFVLVYIKDGKQSRSTGQYALAGGQLTLTGSDGTKFAGTLGTVTAKSFEFTPPTSAKLTFQKAA
jgi:hypothetical protein